MESPKCPLYIDAKLADQSTRMTLHKVKAIENHVSTQINSCPHPPLKDLVFKGSIDGTTPLLIACDHGELEAVQHIVECWGVDIKSTAKYSVDLYSYLRPGAKILQATPLFVAAYRWHPNIVRYLVGKGADVSARTFSGTDANYNGLTPLYGVLFKDRFVDINKLRYRAMLDIIHFLLESGADPSALPSNGYPIWTKSICGVDAAKELINHGLDLQQRDPGEGRTLLHHWAASLYDFDYLGDKRKDLVKLLLEKGANVMAQDYSGFTPVLVAALNKIDRRCPNWSTLDLFLERDDVSRMEKIDAMEVAGAVILSDNQNLSLFEKAFEYWRRALQLRLMDAEGSDPLPKTLLNLKSGQIMEWVTQAQLEYVIEHPDEHVIQSFLVRLRIFISRKKYKALYKPLLSSYYPTKNFSNFRKKLILQKRFIELHDIFWAILEAICLLDPHEEDSKSDTSNDQSLWEMTLKIVKHFFRTLSNLKRVDEIQLLNEETVNKSLELIFEKGPIDWQALFLTNNKFIGSRPGGNDRIMRCLFKIVRILAGFPQQIPKEGFMNSLMKIVRLELRNAHGQTLLHFACNSDLSSVRLLLEAGADPTIADKDGNAPLYILSMLDRSSNATANVAYWREVDFLLERDDIAILEKIEAMELAGATILFHPDITQNYERAFDYWRRALRLRRIETASAGPYHKTVRRSGDSVEWVTEDELEYVIQHPSEYFVQSFLVRLRILSSKSWEAVNSFLGLQYFLRFNHYNPHNRDNQPNAAQLLNTIWAILDMFSLLNSDEKHLWHRTFQLVNLRKLTLQDLKESNSSFFNFETIQRSLHLLLPATEKFYLTVDRRRKEDFETDYTKGLLSISQFLLDLPDMLLTDDTTECIVKLLRPAGHHELESLLLQTCSGYSHLNYLAFAVRLLLQAGADPNTCNYDGDGPLHFVARWNLERSGATGCLLLGYGAQLHRSNKAGKTAVDVWIERNQKDDFQNGNEEAVRLRPDWCRTVPKLQCLSARCVRVHEVYYSKCPTLLRSFIEKH